MSRKNKIRSDNTYIISEYKTDNPKLGAKILSDGRASLFLDSYLGYKKVFSEKLGREVIRKDRKREFLKLYIYQKPKNPIERQQNKDSLLLAQKIRFERSQILLEDREGYRLRTQRNVNFLDFFQTYIDRYTKKDKGSIKMAYRRFRDFLHETEEFKCYEKKLNPKSLTKDMVEAYTEYLQSRSEGGGAKSVYARFKKVVKYAVEHGVMMKNPCDGIVIKADDQVVKKAILSEGEIKTLLGTHYDNENQNIRRAFEFCLYTGLRFCDVKDLTFANIDISNGLMVFEQNKTRGHSSMSCLTAKISPHLLGIIKSQNKPINSTNNIFPLPSYKKCLIELQKWVDEANINKHITWHCARHSFSFNILKKGATQKTLSRLLGHSSTKHTEKYIRALDCQCEDALNSLQVFEQ